MTPEEIEKHFGKESLEMLYDCVLQNPAYALADWIFSLMPEKEIAEWINQLKADREETE
jgi:hypothetical protein